jgi:hypothetical protein
MAGVQLTMRDRNVTSTWDADNARMQCQYAERDQGTPANRGRNYTLRLIEPLVSYGNHIRHACVAPVTLASGTDPQPTITFPFGVIALASSNLQFVSASS